MNILNSTQVARKSLTVANQVYHINCARKEHGDERVITELASHIRENTQLSVPESIRSASNILINIDDLSTGRIQGKEIRNNLKDIEGTDYEFAL